MKTTLRHAFYAALVTTFFTNAPLALADEKDHRHDDHEKHEGHGRESGHGHEEEESSSKFGPGKAIEAVKEDGKHFKLSEKSRSTIDVKFGEAMQVKPDTFTVPKTALVHFQDEVGVYVERDGWFEMIEVTVKDTKAQTATVVTDELRAKDRVVTNGVALLRIAHLEALGQGGQGHVH